MNILLEIHWNSKIARSGIARTLRITRQFQIPVFFLLLAQEKGRENVPTLVIMRVRCLTFVGKKTDVSQIMFSWSARSRPSQTLDKKITAGCAKVSMCLGLKHLCACLWLLIASLALPHNPLSHISYSS